MSKTLEELGYKKIETKDYVSFWHEDKNIIFDKHRREIEADKFVPNGILRVSNITMEELKAIYKWCEDNKWI